MNWPGSPWTADQALKTVALVAIGAVAVLVAWAVISGRPGASQQLGFVCLGLGGVIVAFLGQASWLLHGRRAVGSRARYLLGEAPDNGAAVFPASSADALVAGDGLRWYHRGDCPVAAGQRFATVSRDKHEAAGRRPCGICQP
jgi:hypothetical protein